MTIVMREIQLRLAAKAWLEQASRRSAEWSHFRLSDPWLNGCLQANAFSDQCLPNSTLLLINALVVIDGENWRLSADGKKLRYSADVIASLRFHAPGATSAKAS